MERMKIRKEIKDKACRLLSVHTVFAGANQAALAGMLDGENALLHDVVKGQQVYPCRNAKKAVVLLLSGEAAIKRGGKIISTAAEGEIFGLQELYSENEAGFTVSALSDCRTVILRKTAVDELISGDFSVAQGYLCYLSHKIIEAEKASAVSTATSAESKLAQYLLSRPVNAANEISLPQDMAKLAKQLGLGKDGLYRALDKLNTSGAIGFSGAGLVLKSRELLATFGQ